MNSESEKVKEDIQKLKEKINVNQRKIQEMENYLQ